jgi:hypothetical protein
MHNTQNTDAVKGFKSHLAATGLLINTQRFTYNGATPHTANIILAFSMGLLVQVQFLSVS